MDYKQALEYQVCTLTFAFMVNLADNSSESRHADAEAGIRETLGELGLEYLDLFLIHWPVNSAGGKPTFDHVEVEISCPSPLRTTNLT